jgi:hypothetical protein
MGHSIKSINMVLFISIFYRLCQRCVDTSSFGLSVYLGTWFWLFTWCCKRHLGNLAFHATQFRNYNFWVDAVLCKSLQLLCGFNLLVHHGKPVRVESQAFALFLELQKYCVWVHFAFDVLQSPVNIGWAFLACEFYLKLLLILYF